MKLKALGVVGESDWDCVPPGEYRLGCDYLLQASRFARREVTVDIYLSEVGSRTIDVECSLPDSARRDEIWYLPLAFLPKLDVAPNLEVTDENGQIIPVPTKLQNFALTRRAIEDLRAEGRLTASGTSTFEFIDELVEDVPVNARARRMRFEQIEPQNHEMIALLRLLEENFVLWVPVCGDSNSRHQFRICRQEIRRVDPIVDQRRKRVVRSLDTALGPLWIEGNFAETNRPTIRVRSAVDRLAKALALRPIEASLFDSEAKRALSSHLRINAPTGFLVRDVRAGEMLPPAPGGYPQVNELDPRENGVVIQGWDQNLGHIHLARRRNPDEVNTQITLGPMGGAISLWMLTAVLTAALLWIAHHHSSYAPQLAGPADFQTITGNNKQIAAAVLLVAPAFASAWSMRAEGGELLRSFFSGARFLLLLSAAFSVATALALAEILPARFSDYEAIELYASGAYLVAMPMVGAWLLSRRSLWMAFRFGLRTPNLNLFAIWVIGVAVETIGALHLFPSRLVGWIVLMAGLVLGAIGGNSVAQPLRLDRTGTYYRTLAGFGALPMVGIAGSFLGFYAHLFSTSNARAGCVVIGAALAMLAPFGTTSFDEEGGSTTW